MCGGWLLYLVLYPLIFIGIIVTHPTTWKIGNGSPVLTFFIVFSIHLAFVGFCCTEMNILAIAGVYMLMVVCLVYSFFRPCKLLENWTDEKKADSKTIAADTGDTTSDVTSDNTASPDPTNLQELVN